MRTSVRVEGLNKLVRDLQALGLTLDDLKGAFGAIASQGADVAERLAPKRTGTLAASARGSRAKNKAIVTVGSARIPWAGPVNYGWPARGIKPSLFMQRTDVRMQPVALDELDKELGRAIRRRGLD